ncbi:hypothetical protein F0Z19_4485 [Vibrio cyclitrophicus]|nr:hypothetical protein F0Z19_4485 [Vibrio cyclitrophicus]
MRRMELWKTVIKIKLTSLTMVLIVGCSVKGDPENTLTIDSIILEGSKGSIENLSELQGYKINVESGNIEDVEVPVIKYKILPFDMLNKAPICKKFSGDGVKITNNSGIKENELIVSQIAKKVNNAFGCSLSVEYEINDSNSYGAFVVANKVVLSNGLILESEYMDELFFVIAHEIVHKVLLHSEQISLIESKKGEAQDQKALETYSYLKNITVPQEADKFIKNYNVSHFTTNNLKIPHEVAADILAVDILVRAGYSPQATKLTLERIASCLNYNDGDWNKDFAELQDKAESFNKDKNKSMEKYFSILHPLMKQTHLPSPWREKTVTNYIKVNYPAHRRLKMTPINVGNL